MNRPTIICIDDEKIVLTSIKEQLKTAFRDEYDIEVHDNGLSALEVVQELLDQKVDVPLVISDQVMPGMKGDELLAAIHKISPETMKILLTGQADAKAVGNAVNFANLYRYISKPWEREDLILTAKEALRSYYTDKSLQDQNQILLKIKEQLEALNSELDRKVKLFNRFVPIQFLKILNLEKDRDHIQLGECAETQISILFADVRSFTLISDSLSPIETFQYVYQLFTSITPFISANDGFIDKFIGDAMMALFKDPNNALKTAIDIQQFLCQSAKENESYQMGIAINTGTVVLGTVGGSDHMETTVLGDTVNVASRTEHLTRKYNTPLLITQNTYNSLKNPLDYQLRNIDRAAIRGKHELIEIYEVLDALPASLREKKLAIAEKFKNARICFDEKNYLEAKKIFAECLKECPEDDVSRLYISRIDN